MENTEFGAGSSDPRNRQEGSIVPAPLRSEEFAPKSCDGQNTDQVSTAGIWIGLATAGDAPPPEYFPELKGAPPGSILATMSGSPRALGPGEFLARREQFQRGVVRDTICRRDGERCSVVENFEFRGWLAGLRPGVKPFFLREDRDGDLTRVSYEREGRELHAKELREYEEFVAEDPGMMSVLDPPSQPRDWPGEEPDKVLSPLPSLRGLRGGC